LDIFLTHKTPILLYNRSNGITVLCRSRKRYRCK